MTKNEENKQSGVAGVLYGLWGLLELRRKLQIFVTSLLIIVSGFAEMVSIGAVVPFLSALVSPELLNKFELVLWITDALDIQGREDLLFFLTVTFCCSAVAAGLIRMTMFWANSRLTLLIGHDIEALVFKRTLHHPYHRHIARHSGEVIATIDKAKLTGATFFAAISIVEGAIVGSLILVALVSINFAVAMWTIGVLGGAYVSALWIARRFLQRNSAAIAQSRTARIKIIQEGLGGIRDVLLDGAQGHFTRRFNSVNLKLTRSLAINKFVGQVPRTVVESIGLVAIAIVSYSLSGGDTFSKSIPIMGALALGAQRLMPILQRAYSGWARLQGSHYSMFDIIVHLKQGNDDNQAPDISEPMKFERTIEFRNVAFSYAKGSPAVIQNLNFSVEKGSRVGLVGATGSGKSTILDLFMGLLTPSHGTFLIDGVPLLPDKLRTWQRNISHVPQHIFLTDGTITENIAFGTPKNRVDQDRVRWAARVAQIDGYIESTEEKYDLIVGERGVKLSGGQRQRLGIARAVYKQSPVLVLDEATSALDLETELKVVRSIEEYAKDTTLLIVSHRHSILRTCDHVYSLDSNRALELTAPDELVQGLAL